LYQNIWFRYYHICECDPYSYLYYIVLDDAESKWLAT
jgi:hypothetical protein